MSKSKKFTFFFLAVCTVALVAGGIYVFIKLRESQVPTDVGVAGGTVECGGRCTAHGDCAGNMMCYDNHCFLCDGPCTNSNLRCPEFTPSCDAMIDFENVSDAAKGLVISDQYNSTHGVTFSTGPRIAVDGTDRGACSSSSPLLQGYLRGPSSKSSVNRGFKNDLRGSYHPQTKQKCKKCEAGNPTCSNPCLGIPANERLYAYNWLDSDVMDEGGDWFILTHYEEDDSLPCQVIVDLTVPTMEFSLDLIDIDNTEGWDVIGYDDDGNEIPGARMHVDVPYGTGEAEGPGMLYDGDLLRFTVSSNQLIYRVVIQPSAPKIGYGFGFAMDNFSPYCAQGALSCGDGIADPGEECGEPGLSCPSGQTCTDCVCSGGPVCGDGVLDPGEECDYNASPTGCQTGYTCNANCNCLAPPDPVCGDGTVDPNEECDYNADPTGCDAGYTCTGTCTCIAPPATCGDGVLDPGEECDYNADPTGCQTGYTCSGACECLGPPPEICGDGTVDPGEECDYNANPTGCASGYACNANCHCRTITGLPDTGLFDDPGSYLVLFGGMILILMGLLANRYGQVLSFLGIETDVPSSDATSGIISSLGVEDMLATGEEGYGKKLLKSQEKKIKKRRW